MIKNNNILKKPSHFFIKTLSFIFVCIFSLTIYTPSLCLAIENSSKDANFLQNYIDLNDSTAKSHFFSFLSRMKHINRWGLLRNIRQENLEEHSFEAALIAHALATTKNQYFNGHVNAERAAILALYHDSTETIIGDAPTLIKYYNRETKETYSKLENVAANNLLDLLPDKMKVVYVPLLKHSIEDKELWDIVKAADRISALIKCLEERTAGNLNFVIAEKAIIKSIQANKTEEVDFFMKEFMPSYGLNIDDYNTVI